MRRAVAVVAALVVVVVTASGAVASVAKAPALYKNCTNLNKRYPHGVGRFGAHDKTSGTAVTNFYRSNRVYAVAIKWNKGLDRDHDGIACEKQ